MVKIKSYMSLTFNGAKMSFRIIPKSEVILDAKNLPTKTKKEAQEAKKLLVSQGKAYRTAVK